MRLMAEGAAYMSEIPKNIMKVAWETNVNAQLISINENLRKIIEKRNIELAKMRETNNKLHRRVQIAERFQQSFQDITKLWESLGESPHTTHESFWRGVKHCAMTIRHETEKLMLRCQRLVDQDVIDNVRAINQRDAELAKMREALGRISSGGLGHPNRNLSPTRDRELLDIMGYARTILKELLP